MPFVGASSWPMLPHISEYPPLFLNLMLLTYQLPNSPPSNLNLASLYKNSVAPGDGSCR